MVRRRRKTKAEQAEEWAAAKRHAWEAFEPRLALLETLEDAHRLMAEVTPPDTPARSYFSNFAFFLDNLSPPGGAGLTELNHYFTFVGRLEAAGTLTADAAARVKAKLQQAIDGSRLW